MRKFVAHTVSALSALFLCWNAAPVGAAEMQPGLWRFTQTTSGGPRARARASTRCVTPEQAKDPVRYFTPAGQSCVLASHSSFGSRISSSLRCTEGDTTTDVNATIVFSSPAAMTITTTVAAQSPRGSASAVMHGTGQLIGACGGRRRG